MSFSFGGSEPKSAPAKAATSAAVPPAAANKKPPPVAKVNRKYATEDERIAAEASVEATNARLEEVTFDFSFGS